ncbi:MAG: right-handed parallel beta-helix repeat-containing protein [Ignavibacteriaceae bacterium]
MKIQFILFSLMTLTIISNAQTIIQPGDVSGTWTLSGSPYEIQGEITIPNDSTLTIEPGVLVEFQGYYKFNVQGRLLAVGTSADTITFTINDTTGFHNPDTTLGGWNGIEFIDTPLDNDTSKIIYCKLQYGKAVGSSPPENSGGAVVILNFNKVLISNCLISNNSAGGLNSPAGGGIYMAFASIILEENEISNNSAWDGGGILIYECDPVFVGNLIDSNHADEGGGGIWIGGLSNSEFNYDIISNNFASGNGGGMICWQTTNTSLNTVNILSNTANWGGGIGVIECELQLINCNINNNSAISLGGGLGSDFSTVYINNTTFASDTSGFGGAIHSDFCELQIDSCDFIGNKAIDGGAIHTSNTNLLIDSCQFFQNEAVNIGGGIQYHIDTTDFLNPYQVEILNSRFVQNSAFYRGAIEIQQLYSETSLVDVKIDKCEFIENTIDRGANLLISGFIDDFIISNSIFRGNTAVLRTATCNLSGNVKGQVINCLFTSNHTLGGGAASSIGSGSNVSIINCTFANNIGGAALTFRNDAHSMLINNIFWGNENYNIIVNAVNDTTPCTLNINYSDIQYGLDSIFENDTVSVVNWGPGNINEDPLFADTLNNDFHLQDMSPCIAVGIDSIEIAGFWYYAPLTDIEGNPRPNPIGTMPDMGAYESEYAVRVEENETGHLTEYALDQNYPNPFNPATIIKYALPEESFISIKIYNTLGEEIAELVNETKAAGNYEVSFSASNLASGIYFYRLKAVPTGRQAGSFIETKKMVLMK